MSVIGVLLAAGGGRRFAGETHKLLAALHDRPVWRWSLEHLLAAHLDHVIVVSGAADIDWPAGVDVIRNPHWESGQASSLQLAIAAAGRLGSDAVVVGLADQPFVDPATWRAVAEADASCPVVVTEYDGRRGPNPVRLARSIWPLLPTTGDDGARTLMREHPAWVCSVPGIGSAADIDTLEDLERWTNC
jgi:molybdenum cofactor cytidylyltransferase